MRVPVPAGLHGLPRPLAPLPPPARPGAPSHPSQPRPLRHQSDAAYGLPNAGARGSPQLQGCSECRRTAASAPGTSRRCPTGQSAPHPPHRHCLSCPGPVPDSPWPWGGRGATGEAQLAGTAEGAVQRRRAESGNSWGDTAGSLVVPWGHEEEARTVGTALVWQGLLSDRHLRWHRDPLTQHMETRLLKETITSHFPGL